MLLRALFIGLFVYLLIGLFSQAKAATMSNDSYTIEKRSVNIQPYIQDSPKKPDIVPQKPYASGTNYTIETNKPFGFSFSLSQDVVDFGKLTATNPVIRDVDLTITSFGNYQLLAAQDHPLRTQNNLIIPDTTCDNGSCSEITAAPWSNTLTYGFGYKTEAMQDNMYKQFGDSSRNEAMQSFLQGGKAQNQQPTLTYKVNISGTQTPGAYSNSVIFIATPDY